MPALTLDQPVTYQITVPGVVDSGWADWATGLTVTIEQLPDCTPVSVLTCQVDQAALIGLLRRLYALGLPLMSVQCVDVKGTIDENQ